MKSHFHTPTNQTDFNITFFARMYTCFQPWPHVYVNIGIFVLDNKYTHTLSKAVHEPYDLFGENMPSISANFDHVFEVFQGLFFAFLL